MGTVMQMTGPWKWNWFMEFECHLPATNGLVESRKGMAEAADWPALAVANLCSVTLLPIGTASPSLDECFLVRFGPLGLMKTYLPRTQTVRG